MADQAAMMRAQMLADLGNERRDEICAIDVDSKGHEVVDDGSRELSAVEFARRRQQMQGGHDDNLRKWHTPEVFDNDPIAAQQQDFFGGQGHRAALARSVAEMQANGPAYVTAAHHNLLPRRGTSHIPRTFSAPPHERGRTLHSTPSRDRAPSPRASGTIRFPPMSKRPTNPPLHQYPNGVLAAKRQSTPDSSSDEQTVINGVIDPNTERIHQTMANDYAARPFAERDDYYEKHPELKPYLFKAWKAIVREALQHANASDGKGAAEYYGLAEKKKWVFDAADMARRYVLFAKEADADAYYATRPAYADFYKAAKANKAKLRPHNGDTPPEPALRPLVGTDADIQSELFLSSHTSPRSPTATSSLPTLTAGSSAVGTAPPDLETLPATTYTPNSTPSKRQQANTPAKRQPQKGWGPGFLSAIFVNEQGETVDNFAHCLALPGRVDMTIRSCDDRYNSTMLKPAVQKFAEAIEEIREMLQAAQMESVKKAQQVDSIANELAMEQKIEREGSRRPLRSEEVAGNVEDDDMVITIAFVAEKNEWHAQLDCGDDGVADYFY